MLYMSTYRSLVGNSWDEMTWIQAIVCDLWPRDVFGCVIGCLIWARSRVHNLLILRGVLDLVFLIQKNKILWYYMRRTRDADLLFRACVADLLFGATYWTWSQMMGSTVKMAVNVGNYSREKNLYRRLFREFNRKRSHILKIVPKIQIFGSDSSTNSKILLLKMN